MKGLNCLSDSMSGRNGQSQNCQPLTKELHQEKMVAPFAFRIPTTTNRHRSRWKVDSPADCVARRVAFFSVPSSSGPAPAPSSAPSSTGSAPAPSSAPSSRGSTPAPSSAPMAWPATARAQSRCQRLAHARRRKACALQFAPAPSPTCA